MKSSYKLEEGIDFYKELNLIMKSDNNIDDMNCLITKLPLTENHIKLTCNHSFNYYPLFCEIYKQKYNLNTFLNKNLDKGKFKCPYCRTEQNYLLEYRKEYDVPLIYGINTDDLMFQLEKDKTNKFVYSNTINYFKGECCYSCTDAETNETSLCKNTLVIIHKNTSKTYCLCHINKVKFEYIKAESQKLKAQTQKLKEEIKKVKEEQKKKIKEEQKQQLKEEQKKKKEEQKKIKEEQKSLNEENQSNNNIILFSTCTKILKTGKNKGLPCGCKALKDNLCGKHYDVNTDILTNTI